MKKNDVYCPVQGPNEKKKHIYMYVYIYIYIYIYIYSLKKSEDGQLLTIKKLKNLIKNKNVSVLDLHQLHDVTDEGLRPKRFYFLLNFLTF